MQHLFRCVFANDGAANPIAARRIVRPFALRFLNVFADGNRGVVREQVCGVGWLLLLLQM